MNIPIFKNTENVPHTSKETGETVFASRSAAVAVLFVARVSGTEHVLVVKRGPIVSHSGLWCLPCGYLDHNENLQSAASRELFEETGIFVEARDMSLFKMDDDPASFRQNLTFFFSVNRVLSQEAFEELKKTLRVPEPEIVGIEFVERGNIGEKTFAFNHEQVII